MRTVWEFQAFSAFITVELIDGRRSQIKVSQVTLRHSFQRRIPHIDDDYCMQPLGGRSRRTGSAPQCHGGSARRIIKRWWYILAARLVQMRTALSRWVELGLIFTCSNPIYRYNPERVEFPRCLPRDAIRGHDTTDWRWAQRLRRWPNINPSCRVFRGLLWASGAVVSCYTRSWVGHILRCHTKARSGG